MIVTTLLGVSSLSFFAVEKSSLLRAQRDVCGRLLTDFVKRQEIATRKFVEICLEESEQDVDRALSMRKFMSPKRALIEILNQRLSAIRISHLGAYAPNETVALWTGESVDTGARGRIVDGEIIVTRVLPGSASEKSGLTAGDLVVAVDGNPIQDPDELREASGFWEIIRPDETRVNVLIRAEVFQESLVPRWVESQEKKGIRVLRIPSFLAQAIESDEWTRIQDEIIEMQKRGDRLVIDIRGNGGGSFPAMLRVLGTLKCDRVAGASRSVGCIAIVLRLRPLVMKVPKARWSCAMMSRPSLSWRFWKSTTPSNLNPLHNPPALKGRWWLWWTSIRPRFPRSLLRPSKNDHFLM